VFGLRPLKLLLGLLTGAVVGGLVQALDGDIAAALVAAAVAVVYRVVSAVLYRGRPLVRVMAEEVPAARAALRRPDVRCERRASADPRVLRAHEPLRALDRA